MVSASLLVFVCPDDDIIFITEKETISFLPQAAFHQGFYLINNNITKTATHLHCVQKERK